MLVNISRNKQLINSKRLRKSPEPVNTRVRCNHCGGWIRMDGELNACMMCSRQEGHTCENCSNIPEESLSKAKK